MTPTRSSKTGAEGAAPDRGFARRLGHGALGLLAIAALLPSPAAAQALSGRLEAAWRVDDDTRSEPVHEYRVRAYGQWRFAEAWSLNAFAVTGEAFESTWNGVEGASDRLDVRRLYLRHAHGRGKTEVGMIPPYKGDVASTGLSKDGWIFGARHVIGVARASLLEFVLGELDPDREPGVLDRFETLDYGEIEFTSRFAAGTKYELGAQHLVGSSFLRGLVRREREDESAYALEVIARTDNQRVKVVASIERRLPALGDGAEVFAYYTRVDHGFGRRASLAEDFLENGHALAVEFEGPIGRFPGLSWFADVEYYERSDITRAHVGIEYERRRHAPSR